MLPTADEGQKRIRKYLSENATPEVKPISKEKKDETPKNTESDSYDYNDDPNSDDKEW